MGLWCGSIKDVLMEVVEILSFDATRKGETMKKFAWTHSHVIDLKNVM